MRKVLVEFIGTLFLVLTIGLVVIEPGAGSLAPLAIGSILAVMVYAGGHVSGAHYNPAVTLSIWLRGKITARDAVSFAAAQGVAGILAALIARFLKSNPAVVSATPEVLPALAAEFAFTFALCYVVLNVATAEGTQGNSYFGLAIGFTVLAGAYAVGPISGAAFNPAVALGLTVMGLSAAMNLWIFLAANLLGGVAAAMAFRAISRPDS